MCQLFGVNSAKPTSFSFCFKGFCRRGGDTDCHKDGWGIALYEGRGLRTFLDAQACAKSPAARFVQEYPTKSQNVIGHIRCATHGRVGLETATPFVGNFLESHGALHTMELFLRLPISELDIMFFWARHPKTTWLTTKWEIPTAKVCFVQS